MPNDQLLVDSGAYPIQHFFPVRMLVKGANPDLPSVISLPIFWRLTLSVALATLNTVSFIIRFVWGWVTNRPFFEIKKP